MSEREQTTIRASYRYVHGAHFFTSPEVPGLCAADRDISTAYDAVGTQLATLMGGEWMPREQFPHNQAWPIGDQLVWVKSVTRDVQEHQNPPPPEVATPQPGQGGCAPPTSGGPHRFASPQEGEIEIVTDDQTTPPGPPDSWAHLGMHATPEEVAASDAEHAAWLASPAGETWLDWDRRVVALANDRGLTYREAMEQLSRE